MNVTPLTKETFQQAITPTETVIVDFWAPWCGPCQNFAPIFDQAARNHPDMVFASVNTDEQQELAGALGIRSIPTLMVFREQIMLFLQSGALSASQLEDLLEKIGAIDMATVHADSAANQTGKTSG